jgi:hypothetical protein
MSNRVPLVPANASAEACVMLAIPNEAIRVTAAPPDTISQRNVEAATGVPSRAYLEAVRDPGFPLSVTRLGKLRIVNRAAFITWLERGAFGGGRKEECGGEAIATNLDAPAREEDAGDGKGIQALLGTVGLREQHAIRRPRRKR